MFLKATPQRLVLKGYKTNDCTVNAIGNALGVSYDLSRRYLQRMRFSSKGEHWFANENTPKSQFYRTHVLMGLIAPILKSEAVLNVNSFGYFAGWTRSTVKMTFETFAALHPVGTFFVLSKSHIAVVKDGHLLDTWDSSENEIKLVGEVDSIKAKMYTLKLISHMKLTKEHITYKDNRTQINNLKRLHS